jgi:hypothetical protein
VKRTHAAAAAVLLLLIAPGLTGCFSGKEATTTQQATMNSGNGVASTLGPIHIENATLVMGPEGSKSATLTMRIVNTGSVADTLVFATINGQPATITGDKVPLEPGGSISFGFDSKTWVNAYTFDAPVASYVPVQLGFQVAGLTDTLSILTVPPVGYYAGIAPNPPQAPVAPVASIAPSAAASPAASASAS